MVKAEEVKTFAGIDTHSRNCTVSAPTRKGRMIAFQLSACCGEDDRYVCAFGGCQMRRAIPRLSGLRQGRNGNARSVHWPEGARSRPVGTWPSERLRTSCAQRPHPDPRLRRANTGTPEPGGQIRAEHTTRFQGGRQECLPHQFESVPVFLGARRAPLRVDVISTGRDVPPNSGQEGYFGDLKRTLEGPGAETVRPMR
jgi:hypothetical protein